MSSFRIFYQRLIHNWQHQYKTFRTVADWTVIVYLIIPAIIIGFFVYRSWWLKGIPDWTMVLPASLFVLLGYIVAWGGTFRTYVEEGDKVFLIKHPKLFLNLKNWGFLYSIVSQFISTLLFIVLLLPFLKYHSMLNTFALMSFIIFLFSMKLLFMHGKFHLKKISGKWLRFFANIIVFLVLARMTFWLANFWMNGDWLFFVTLPLLAGASSVVLHYKMLKKPYLFDHHLKMEMDEKMKGTQMIFQMSFEMEKPKIITRKKPWLFRNSKQIFKNRNPKNGFLELFYKVFIRNDVYVTTFLQITSITSAAIVIIPPLWIKIVIFCAYLFMLSIWLDGTWERIVSAHPFMKKYKEHESYFAAKISGIRSLFTLSVILNLAMVSVGLWIYKFFSNLL